MTFAADAIRRVRPLLRDELDFQGYNGSGMNDFRDRSDQIFYPSSDHPQTKSCMALPRKAGGSLVPDATVASAFPEFVTSRKKTFEKRNAT